jgi:hypothetical protein
MDGLTLDSTGIWLFEKSPASKDRYPSTPSASAVATTMKRRERTIAVPCLVPGGTGLSRTTDFSGRWGTPDDASLTSTRFASQEEQETCFHLIEEGCESTSFGFAQRGQATVIIG